MYTINNDYGYDKDYKYLDKVLDRTLSKEGVKDAIFSIIFVDSNTIQDINREYRGIDKETDVISFALEDNENINKDETRVPLKISVNSVTVDDKVYDTNSLNLFVNSLPDIA